MAMQQCPNGHLYDDSKNSSCPYCGGANNSINVTVPLDFDNSFDSPHIQGGQNAFPSTVPLENNQRQMYSPNQGFNSPMDMPRTMAVDTGFAPTQYVDNTVNESGMPEVRGWLVCLEGSKRGMDFKIHGEKNSIGRGAENDIKIEFDSSVSKGVNAVIAYDRRNNKFFIYQGNSKNNIYINNQLLMSPIEIKDYDVIEIGKTKMVFRSLCNEQFNWDIDK